MIKIRGARQHNLKNIDIDIPHNELIVITGLSGSGKSTLAFDTLYAEGQRRYVESLSTYSRQFLTRMEKPDVDLIEGLSPAIAVDQKSVDHNPRSTVGTVTEIYDFMRLLYSRVGVIHCHKCGDEISPLSIDQMIESIFRYPENALLIIISPLLRSKPNDYSTLIRQLKLDGFARLRINGSIMDIANTGELDIKQIRTLEVIVDRLILRPGTRNRIADSLELALSLSGGYASVEYISEENQQAINSLNFYEKTACPNCGISFPELTPAYFSFNSPEGACPECNGLGSQWDTDPESKEEIKRPIFQYPCQSCKGSRLRPESRVVTISRQPIHRITALSIKMALSFFRSLNLDKQRTHIAMPIIRQIIDRLDFIHDIGLPYLTLDRPAYTLSGGESHRIRLATQIGAKLTGVLYVLDEPSIGLHPRDIKKLLLLIKKMRDAGNTMLVVEHDQEAIHAADHVIDMGPGGGTNGGQVVFQGLPQVLATMENSLTGQYYSGRLKIPTPNKRRNIVDKFINIEGASHNNLKGISVSFPLGRLICVSGVSGSGKSSLVIDTLYAALMQQLYGSRIVSGVYQKLNGLDHIDKVISIDQAPIGRTPRSNPATYTGLFTVIRNLFAKTPEARMRGYKQGRFSFNARGGRCEACSGDGVVRIEMHFLPDVFVSCDVCQGKRYNRETLEVRYKGKNIADVLDLTVEQALVLFRNIPKARGMLQTLVEAGLGYIHLGQSATTLSGGEAQRIKLARELSKRNTGFTLYILDEPTTGLHMDDIRRLLEVLHRLVDQGNTVIIIEHHLDVIKSADYVIDLGPEGGEGGGYVIGCGTPEEIAGMENSYTGRYLHTILSSGTTSGVKP